MSVIHNPNVVRDGMDFYIDFANPKCYNPNMFPNPTDLFAWFGAAGAYRATISRDTGTISPVGNTPMLFTQTGGDDPYTHAWNQPQFAFGDVTQGDYVAWSMWVKADAPCMIKHYQLASNAAGQYIDGGVSSSFIGTTTPTITTEWTRLCVVNQITSAQATKVFARIDGEFGTATTGRKIWVDGLNVTKISAVAVPPFYDRLGSLTTANSCLGNARNGIVGSAVRFNPAGYAALPADLNGAISTTNLGSFPSAWTEGASLEVWMKIKSDHVWSTTYRSGIFAKGSTDGSFGLAMSTTNNSVLFWIRDTVVSQAVGANITRDSWVHLVGRYNGHTNVSSISVNGVHTNLNLTARSGAPDLTEYWIGGANVGFAGDVGLPTKCDIALARKYNRALSDAEVMQNFNAQRGRFGV